jgi:SAM-dependent methyltransferase
VLAYRELLEAKLAFLDLAAGDVARHLGAFLRGPEAFMAEARVFDLFRYDRCLEVTAGNLAATRPWVAYTSALTRYEAEAGLDRLDLGERRRLLDIGGNSGAFALAACRRHPGLLATVFDLPVVAAIGREHVAGTAEAARIRFVAGDMRRDPLPDGHDAVLLKSVLHDWPEPEAQAILTRAARRVAPGGVVAVFERGKLPLTGEGISYAMTANLVFGHFFRPAGLYAETMAAAGLTGIVVETIPLDVPFHLVTGRRPG